MLQIKQLKIRTEVYITKINYYLIHFLIWVLSKLDTDILTKCTITEKIEIDIKRYIPQDGKWHHFTYNVECWANYKEIVKHEKFYVDGGQNKIKKGKKK